MSGRITKTVVIERDRKYLYSLWSDLERFPCYMRSVQSVVKMSEAESVWTVEGPLQHEVTWEARTTGREENKLLAWDTVHGDVQTSGEVVFSAAGRNRTRIKISLEYSLPAEKAVFAVAKMFKDPEQLVEENLEDFKRFAESPRRESERLAESDWEM